MSDQQSVTTGASVPALHLNLDIAGAKSEAAIAPAGDPRSTSAPTSSCSACSISVVVAIRVVMTRPRRSRPWGKGCSARPRSAARC